MNGGALQDFRYQFDALKGNLTSRSDAVNNLTEGFIYDSLNRLTGMGTRAVTYAANGNITGMGGVGSMTYGNSSKPYQITALTPESSGLVPDRQQSITYTCFSRPASISEGGRTAAFTYNWNDERVKMQEADSTGTICTRHYIGGRYEVETTGSTVKQMLYLGGDAYSAPMVYIKTGSGSWTLYNIGRDYLGSITHIATKTGTLVAEYSYDPWGRLRNPSTHALYAPGTEPSLFLGRGYTGHEHLTWFGLVNMNARLYDPLLGRFLSPDPFVQAPDFTQSFNRYSYALNNPLKYTDPNGEFVFTTAMIVGIAIGATVGLITGYMIGEQHGATGWDMAGYVLVGGLIGGAAGLAGGAVAAKVGSLATAAGYGGFAAGAVTGGLAGAASGLITGTGFSLLDGNSFSDALYAGGVNALYGFAAGALIGGVTEGIQSIKRGNRFIDGASVQRLERSQNIPIIEQRGTNNCVPASIEAVDKSLGGEITQEDIRALVGGDPNLDPVEDLSTWKAYLSETGHSLIGENPLSNNVKLKIFAQLGLGNRVVINLNVGEIGHSVVINKAILEVVTKVNGTISTNVLFQVMNPANGGYYQYLYGNSIKNAYNIFYIIK